MGTRRTPASDFTDGEGAGLPEGLSKQLGQGFVGPRCPPVGPFALGDRCAFPEVGRQVAALCHGEVQQDLDVRQHIGLSFHRPVRQRLHDEGPEIQGVLASQLAQGAETARLVEESECPIHLFLGVLGLPDRPFVPDVVERSLGALPFMWGVLAAWLRQEAPRNLWDPRGGRMGTPDSGLRPPAMR